MNWVRAARLFAFGAFLFPLSAPAASPTYDAIELWVSGAGTGQPVSVSVDPLLDRHPISPLIFGVNFGSAAQASRFHWPVRRWGGNSTTRYSWQHDISNHAMDWFFSTIEEDNPNPAALPDGSAADRFVEETRAAGGAPLVTVPLIG